MTWEPQADGLQQIINILKESQSPDTATQMAVQMVRALFFFSGRNETKKCIRINVYLFVL